MYYQVFLIILIIIIAYFLLFNDTRIEYPASNGVYYKIRYDGSTELKIQKVEFLKNIDTKMRTIINYMHSNVLPNKEIADRVYNRMSQSRLGETPNGDNSAAYTINKGHIYICLITNGKFNDENDSFFVILHELAHIMSNSYGHGEEFKQNFNFIVKLAVKLGLWTPKDYEKENVNYCGVNVTSSPCDNDECSNNNLENYYKESLLDFE